MTNNFVTESDRGHRMMRLQNHYTDDELLIELRRRGRIARVQASDVTPGRYANDFEPHMQFGKLVGICADELVCVLKTHKAIPGAKVEHNRSTKDRRMTMAFNVIVEKGYGNV